MHNKKGFKSIVHNRIENNLHLQNETISQSNQLQKFEKAKNQQFKYFSMNKQSFLTEQKIATNHRLENHPLINYLHL